MFAECQSLPFRMFAVTVSYPERLGFTPLLFAGAFALLGWIMAIKRNDTISVPSRQRWHYARCVGFNQRTDMDCVDGIWEVCAAPDEDRGRRFELLFSKIHYSMMGGNQGIANTDIPNVLAACAPHILKQLLDLPGSIPVTESGGVKASEWLLKRLDNNLIFADLAPWLDGV
jgi:hypothetical protein